MTDITGAINAPRPFSRPLDIVLVPREREPAPFALPTRSSAGAKGSAVAPRTTPEDHSTTRLHWAAAGHGPQRFNDLRELLEGSDSEGRPWDFRARNAQGNTCAHTAAIAQNQMFFRALGSYHLKHPELAVNVHSPNNAGQTVWQIAHASNHFPTEFGVKGYARVTGQLPAGSDYTSRLTEAPPPRVSFTEEQLESLKYQK